MINKYSILNGAKYFSPDGLQNYLVFQLIFTCCSTENDKIESWTSKGMSRERITPLPTTGKNFYPDVIHLLGIPHDLQFKEIHLRQNSMSFSFGAVKLIKNADQDKYKYNGYGTGFDSCS